METRTCQHHLGNHGVPCGTILECRWTGHSEFHTKGELLWRMEPCKDHLDLYLEMGENYEEVEIVIVEEKESTEEWW